jgi:hypothetical protein
VHEDKHKQACDQFKLICDKFNELKDYETASYFYKRWLDVASMKDITDKIIDAYVGLGTCEENVLNIEKAIENFETASYKASQRGNNYKP